MSAFFTLAVLASTPARGARKLAGAPFSIRGWQTELAANFLRRKPGTCSALGARLLDECQKPRVGAEHDSFQIAVIDRHQGGDRLTFFRQDQRLLIERARVVTE